MTLTGRTQVAAVIGWPVTHSRSPALHGYWLESYSIDGVMVPLTVAPQDLKLVLSALPRMGLVGANLTLPHKEAALRLVDDTDAAARAVGAVNTVVVENGRLVGSNTDGFGFVEHLEASAPGWSANREPAVVLGAGGAARAIVYALAELGIDQIRVVNRTQSRAEQLLADLSNGKTKFVPWNQRDEALDGVQLLVNTTSLGMSGQPPLEIALDCLPKHAVVADIVYVPLETQLLKTAARRGHRIVDGLGMLMHQARPGFRAWFGREPEVTKELRAHLVRDLEKERR